MAETKNMDTVSGIVTRFGPFQGQSFGEGKNEVGLQFMIEGYDEIFTILAAKTVGLTQKGDLVTFDVTKSITKMYTVDHESFEIVGMTPQPPSGMLGL